MGIRIDRVYTQTGDEGDTHVAGGGRVPKDSARIRALGAVDELNSATGVVREELNQLGEEAASLKTELEPLLLRIQHKLFDLGAYLAHPSGRAPEKAPALNVGDVRILEEEMDRWKSELPPLDGFVLPGGGRLGALLHLARSICRRAEREVIGLGRAEPVAKPVIPFLNRLSDWFFLASRRAAKMLGVGETIWRPKK